MNEEQAKKVLKNIDIFENKINCKECVFNNETPCLRNGIDCQVMAIETILQLLEQKDNRIDELEKALIDEDFKNKEKIKQLKDKIKEDIKEDDKFPLETFRQAYAKEILDILER